MKGRMRPYLPELTIRDYNTYQWYQRGVRRQLYTTYGLYSCYGLRYNGVLFAVLADSLAGRPATCKRMREPGTLVWRQMMCQTQGIRLAAQVEVLLSWHRIQDAQWADLPFYKKVRRVVDTVLLRRAYRKAAAENPALERIFVQERDHEQNVLKAKQHEREAEIVAQAGKQGAVTIATNMAGRGTDIMLGGNVTYMAKAALKKELSKALTADLAQLKDEYEHAKARAKANGTELPTPPEAEQQPRICSRTASCRGMRSPLYSCPASLAQTAYPPTHESSTACAVSGEASPSTRCMGRNSAAGGAAAVSSSHTTKNGNSAGSTLCRQRAVPAAKPCAAALGAARTSTPSRSAANVQSRFFVLFILRTSLRILD